MNKITDGNKFLLKTECTFLVDNFIGKLKRDFPDYIISYCEDTDKFIELITEINLFNDAKKIVVLKDLDPDLMDVVSSVINQPTDDILIIIQKQTVPRTKAYTVIKGACRLVELKELDESQCAVWVRQWLNELKLIFSEDLPSHIVSRVGTDISKLHSELKKVAAYYTGSSDRVLTQLNCDEFFSESTEIRYFVVVENFFRKRIKEVFEEVKRIDDYSFVKLLYMLIGQTEKLYKIAIFKEQGMSAEDIGNLLGVPKFIISTKMFPCLSFYNKIKLMALLDLFNKLDAELRFTKHPKKLVIESYLLKAMKT